MELLPPIVAALSGVLALDTTRRVGRYGASGMTAGMAAMMAAMGTGLAIGYAAGMAWDLGWATLAGVAAGFGHGLCMGRRYGPLAALDGAGGGVMGGLMGPMLSVMLLALPLTLVWTAGLMLALQWVFGLGAIFLVAATAGSAPRHGLLGAVGWLLGAHLVPAIAVEEPCEPAPAPAGPARHRGATRATPEARTAMGRRPVASAAIAVICVAAVVAAVHASQSGVAPSGQPGSLQTAPVVAPIGPDGVQDVRVTLQAPYYSPGVIELRRGVPARITLSSVGEPG